LAKKKKVKPFIPFSKRTVLSSKYESYILSVILIIMVWFDKDVSSIAILLSLSWGGYRILQNFYINMAKAEHLYEMKLKYRKAKLDDSNLDEETEEFENEDFDDVDMI